MAESCTVKDFNPNPALFKACDERRYNDRFEVLPPIGVSRKGFLVSEPWSHRTCTVTAQYRPTYMALVAHRGPLGTHYFESTSGLTMPEWEAVNPGSLKIEPREVIRFVITNVSSQTGLRTLSLAKQGRHTFESPELAHDALETFRGPQGLPRVLTADEVRSLAVCRCACYPGHHDPVGSYFEDSEIVDSRGCPVPLSQG